MLDMIFISVSQLYERQYYENYIRVVHSKIHHTLHDDILYVYIISWCTGIKIDIHTAKYVLYISIYKYLLVMQ